MNAVRVVGSTNIVTVVFHFGIVRGMVRNTWLFRFERRRSRLVVHLIFYYKA
jgi:hypothetical protein